MKIVNRNFRAGTILTLLTAAFLCIYSYLVGRNDFFLQLNDDLGAAADTFFRLWTNMGDGIIWVAVAILFFFFRKNKFLFLIAVIVISTLLTQVTKIYLIPAEPRPTAAITDGSLIHTVEGVELHTAYSFPSGHTATAFSIFLIACLLMKSRWVVSVGFTCAALVGYSRVYLAQHFPLDLGGGMIVAVISVWASIYFQRVFENRKK